MRLLDYWLLMNGDWYFLAHTLVQISPYYPCLGCRSHCSRHTAPHCPGLPGPEADHNLCFLKLQDLEKRLELSWSWRIRVSPWEENELSVWVEVLVVLDILSVCQHKVPHIPRLDLAEGRRSLVVEAAAVLRGSALFSPVEVPIPIIYYYYLYLDTNQQL